MDSPVTIAKINIEDIDTFPENLVVHPSHPVGVYIQEANDLNEWIKPDIPLLTSHGLEQRYIDGLPKSISLCSLAQAKWLSELKTSRKLNKDQNKKEADYFKFSDDLIHDFRYAFRDSPKLLLTVASIEEGHSKASIVQRLNDLAVLGESNIELLQKINFDTTKLELAVTFSKELATLIATSNVNAESRRKSIDYRNRAFLQLKLIVTEIRRCGKYVFWQTPDRLIGYRSEYNRKQYLKSKASKKKTSSNPDKD